MLPVSAVIPPPDSWIQHSVPHSKLLEHNKIENFNYLNVALCKLQAYHVELKRVLPCLPAVFQLREYGLNLQ